MVAGVAGSNPVCHDQKLNRFEKVDLIFGPLNETKRKHSDDRISRSVDEVE
jgi:hypothetical protein